MLRPGVTQEWVGEGELPRERTKNRRWRRPYDVLAEATHEEVVVRRRVFRVYPSKLVLDESLGRQHMGVVYHRESSQIISTSESHGGDLIILRYDRSSWRVGLLQYSHSLKGARQVKGQSRNCQEDIVVSKQVVKRGEEATMSPVGLSYPKAKRRLERRWIRMSTIVPQRQIYRSRRKG
ncbi:hypothetical protein B296_00006394 [Ensete ventricosum]|uniref:Uncharacterized protein n=1 Tax=Ensete ventricosum TaxID=4639 RepID=A0A426ZC56_ENSVE|nr:hypothetical protein B296_00006394 [Ensete ventricosum]